MDVLLLPSARAGVVSERIREALLQAGHRVTSTRPPAVALSRPLPQRIRPAVILVIDVDGEPALHELARRAAHAGAAPVVSLAADPAGQPFSADCWLVADSDTAAALQQKSGQPADRIVVVGDIMCELWAEATGLFSRARACTLAGLDPSRPFVVCYTLGTHTEALDLGLLLAWTNAQQVKAASEQVVTLTRTAFLPQARLAGVSEVTLAWDPAEPVLLHSLLAHAEALVAMSGARLLDAVIAGIAGYALVPTAAGVQIVPARHWWFGPGVTGHRLKAFRGNLATCPDALLSAHERQAVVARHARPLAIDRSVVSQIVTQLERIAHASSRPREVTAGFSRSWVPDATGWRPWRPFSGTADVITRPAVTAADKDARLAVKGERLKARARAALRNAVRAQRQQMPPAS